MLILSHLSFSHKCWKRIHCREDVTPRFFCWLHFLSLKQSGCLLCFVINAFQPNTQPPLLSGSAYEPSRDCFDLFVYWLATQGSVPVFHCSKPSVDDWISTVSNDRMKIGNLRYKGTSTWTWLSRCNTQHFGVMLSSWSFSVAFLYECNVTKHFV